MTIWVTAVALVAGCGEPPPKMVKITGVVKLKPDGKPLEKVRLFFWPAANGPQSTAITDSEGRYTTTTLDGTMEGVLVGKHKVCFNDTSIIDPDFARKYAGRKGEDVDKTQGKKPRISLRYLNPTLSPVEIEATSDGQEINFEIDPYLESESALPSRPGAIPPPVTGQATQ